MHHAALHMGYRPTVRIIKARRTASIAVCSLCIDDLEGVGGFIEAERMAPDDADAQAIQAELAAFIESLGVTAARSTETYDSLVHAACRADQQHGLHSAVLARCRGPSPAAG